MKLILNKINKNKPMIRAIQSHRIEKSVLYLYSEVEVNMRENGVVIKEMDMGYKLGLMELDMKENGLIIRPVDLVSFTM